MIENELSKQATAKRTDKESMDDNARLSSDEKPACGRVRFDVA
ncbi:hypothetical protein LJPFL01_2756 [Lelliottia jeotgali]|nr:hypothetical protein LJPFL01_2756 [Lelliottia jeotgali]